MLLVYRPALFSNLKVKIFNGKKCPVRILSLKKLYMKIFDSEILCGERLSVKILTIIILIVKYLDCNFHAVKLHCMKRLYDEISIGEIVNVGILYY